MAGDNSLEIPLVGRREFKAHSGFHLIDESNNIVQCSSIDIEQLLTASIIVLSIVSLRQSELKGFFAWWSEERRLERRQRRRVELPQKTKPTRQLELLCKYLNYFEDFWHFTQSRRQVFIKSPTQMCTVTIPRKPVDITRFKCSDRSICHWKSKLIRITSVLWAPSSSLAW